MAGDWIAIRCALPDEPEVIVAADILEVPIATVIGGLVILWAWADQHTEDGHAPRVTRAWLDAHVGVTGFADALAEVGWLECVGRGFRLPKFDRYNTQTAKRRALATIRARNARVRKTSRAQRDDRAPTEQDRTVVKDNPPKPPAKRTPKAPAVEVPPELDTPAFRAAWARYLQHRRESRKSLTPTACSRALAKLVRWGPERSVAAIDHSVGQGWAGIFEPKQEQDSAGRSNRPAGRAGEYDEPTPASVRRL